MMPASSTMYPAPELDPLRLWYVSDERIRSEQAATRAARLVDAIRSGESLSDDLDEQTLFIAMHACAWQAAGQRGGRRPVLSDRRRLWGRRWQMLRDFIVERNLGLVYTMIGRFRAPEVDADELTSEAMIAFVRAVELFNPLRGFRFSTYACNVVVRAIVRRRRAMSNHRRAFSGGEEQATSRVVEEQSDFATELHVERLQRILAGNLGHLTEVEKGVLAQRFPEGEQRAQTFREIGRAIGLSKERVRQIQHEALTKLRTVLREDPVLQ